MISRCFSSFLSDDMPMMVIDLNKTPWQTTIMAVQYDGGVIMGADSRTSTGTYVANRVSDKITSLHDHIYACRSGSAADTQAITDYVRYFLASHRWEGGRTRGGRTQSVKTLPRAPRNASRNLTISLKSSRKLNSQAGSWKADLVC